MARGDVHLVPGYRRRTDPDVRAHGRKARRATRLVPRDVERRRAELLIHGLDDRVREQSTYGRDPRWPGA
jgi:hypothetical protein